MPDFMIVYWKDNFENPTTFFTDDINAVMTLVNQCNNGLDYCEVYVRKYPEDNTDEQARYVFEYSA